MLTKNLEGELLDLYVAKAEGLQFPEIHGEGEEAVVVYLHHETPDDDGVWRPFMPSIEWRDIGPIMYREHIAVYPHNEKWCAATKAISGYDGIEGDSEAWDAPTPQIAACRARVAQVFGEEVPA